MVEEEGKGVLEEKYKERERSTKDIGGGRYCKKGGVILDWLVKKEREERIMERMSKVRGKEDVAGRHGCSDRCRGNVGGGWWE
jgi:hypothetical protein